MTDEETNYDEVAGEHLIRLVDNVERYEEEKKEITNQISDIYAEAKALGLNDKVMRKIIAIRKKDQDALAVEDMEIKLYMDKLGMN